MTLTRLALFALVPCFLFGADPPAAISGAWEISRVIPTTNVQTAPDQSAIGKRFIYESARADLAGTVVDSPDYAVERMESADFAVDFRAPMSELGVSAGSIRVVKVRDKAAKEVTSMGATLFLAGRRRLVTVWDGVFYELRRVR